MLKDDMSISTNQLTDSVSWKSCFSKNVFFSILAEGTIIKKNEEWGGKYNDKNN